MFNCASREGDTLCSHRSNTSSTPTRSCSTKLRVYAALLLIEGITFWRLHLLGRGILRGEGEEGGRILANARTEGALRRGVFLA